MSPKIEQNKQFDELAERLRAIPPERLSKLLNRGTTINFRLSVVEKDQIGQRANRFGLSMTEYLLRLHAVAETVLNDMPLFGNIAPPILNLTNKGNDDGSVSNPGVARKRTVEGKLRRGKMTLNQKGKIKADVIKYMSEGATQKDACREAGTTPVTFRTWMNSDPKFCSQIEALGY